MTFSYSIANGEPRDMVRLMIADTDTGLYVFENEELDALLSLSVENVRYAAADALEIMARSEVMISKRIKILDLTTDGPAVAKELRESAKALRAQADDLALSSEPTIAIAETIINDFQRREWLGREAWRLG